jgi:hypothetical protein|tara:strand:+ start:974 stop:1270 length:297 start_codon:yes stop_codon:yes gene_type:complete
MDNNLNSKKVERLHKYIEVAKMCKWVPPKNGEFTDEDMVDSALNMALQNDTQIYAIYVVISWVPIVYPIFKKQLYTYIDKYGTENEQNRLQYLKKTQK